MVPGLNKLQEKYGEQGLVVVGVTNESAKLVDSSISNQNHTYPIAMVSGGSADTAYGVRGFPTVVLVGPDGNVLTTKERHPESQIVEALKSVVLLPPLEGKRGAAWKSATSMLAKNPEDAQLTGFLESLKASFDGSFQGAISQTEEGAYGGAVETLEKLAKRYKGYPPAEEALDGNGDAPEELGCPEEGARKVRI